MPSRDPHDPRLERKKKRTAAFLFAVIALLLLAPLAVATGWLGGGDETVLVAFLPFAAVGGGEDVAAAASAVGRSLHARFEEEDEGRLTLMDPTAAAEYQGRDLFPVEVGRALRADVVVAGQVRRDTASADASAAVSAQVVRVEDGRALWTGRLGLSDPSDPGERQRVLDWLQDRVGKTLRTVRP